MTHGLYIYICIYKIVSTKKFPTHAHLFLPTLLRKCLEPAKIKFARESQSIIAIHYDIIFGMDYPYIFL